jgi:hypothetical protein
MEQVEDEVDLPEEGPGGYHGSMDDSQSVAGLLPSGNLT